MRTQIQGAASLTNVSHERIDTVVIASGIRGLATAVSAAEVPCRHGRSFSLQTGPPVTRPVVTPSDLDGRAHARSDRSGPACPHPVVERAWAEGVELVGRAYCPGRPKRRWELDAISRYVAAPEHRASLIMTRVAWREVPHIVHNLVSNSGEAGAEILMTRAPAGQSTFA
jgi:hypothetical protein